MKIEVKCDNCKLRYDTDVEEGIHEVSCVCPRCGSPFIYVIPDEVIEAAQAEKTTTPPPTTNSKVKEPAEQPQKKQSQPTNQSKTARKQKPRETTPPFQQTPYPNNQYVNRPPQQRKHGNSCLKNCLIFFVAFTAMVFCMRQCLSFGSVDDESETTYTAVGEGESTSEKDQFEEVKPQQPPEWLQGSWAVTTPYGSITTTIRKNHIAETSGGESNHGTFYYQDGKIYCDFGDGEESVRRLDLKNHRLDAGEGMWMHKIE